jgi:hypothetical protein
VGEEGFDVIGNSTWLRPGQKERKLTTRGNEGDNGSSAGQHRRGKRTPETENRSRDMEATDMRKLDAIMMRLESCDVLNVAKTSALARVHLLGRHRQFVLFCRLTARSDTILVLGLMSTNINLLASGDLKVASGTHGVPYLLRAEPIRRE